MIDRKIAITGRQDAELNLIGILWGRGHFATESDESGTVLREAAYAVRTAHLRQFGSPEARCSKPERTTRGKEGFDALTAILEQLPWEAVKSALTGVSRSTYDDVVNLCVYGRGMPNPMSPKWERWLDRVTWGLAMVANRPARISSEVLQQRADKDAAKAA